MEKQQIIDTANALIAARKELMHTLIGTLALSMLPLVVVLGMLIHGVRLDMNLVLTFLAIPLVVGAVAWVVWWYGESNYHRASDAVLEMTKEYIVRTVTDGLLEDVRIDQPVEKQVLKTVCRQMSLPSHDKARVGTSIRGFYHGKAFQMFDLELIETVTVKERVTDPKTGKKVIEEHTEDNTVFEGQMYQLQQFPRMPETSLLIQKRTENKVRWPGRWDVSAAGGVDAGGTSRQGAEREFREELGYPLDLTGKRPVATVNFPGGFDDFYIVEQNLDLEALTLQAEEVEQVRWVTEEELLDMLDAGTFISYPRSFLQFLFAMRGKFGFPTK